MLKSLVFNKLAAFSSIFYPCQRGESCVGCFRHFQMNFLRPISGKYLYPISITCHNSVQDAKVARLNGITSGAEINIYFNYLDKFLEGKSLKIIFTKINNWASILCHSFISLNIKMFSWNASQLSSTPTFNEDAHLQTLLKPF